MAGSHVDVTSRREAEQAMKESENRHNAIITALPVGVLVIGGDGRLLEQPQRRASSDARPSRWRTDPSSISVRDASRRRHTVARRVVPGPSRPAPASPCQVIGLPQAGAMRWVSVNAQRVAAGPYAVVCLPMCRRGEGREPQAVAYRLRFSLVEITSPCC